MILAARASAAIEILADIEARKRPAGEALKDWGVAHRFAGSGDRAAIGNLVFDCLRTRASGACAMGESSPRALVLRTLVTGWGMTPDEVAALADGKVVAEGPLEVMLECEHPWVRTYFKGKRGGLLADRQMSA